MNNLCKSYTLIYQKHMISTKHLNHPLSFIIDPIFIKGLNFQTSQTICSILFLKNRSTIQALGSLLRVQDMKVQVEPYSSCSKILSYTQMRVLCVLKIVLRQLKIHYIIEKLSKSSFWNKGQLVVKNQIYLKTKTYFY